MIYFVLTNIILFGLYLFFGNKLFTWVLADPLARHLFWMCVLYVAVGLIISCIGSYWLGTLEIQNEDMFRKVFFVPCLLCIFGLPIYKARHSSVPVEDMALYLFGSWALVAAVGVVLVFGGLFVIMNKNY